MIIFAALCLASCDDYDDTELWNKVNGLEERIAALEEWQKTTDNNLNALQTLINTMDYITSVAPIMQANDTIGYTINFHQSTPISIYNGTTSQIGITQDEEGNWLWTLDGEILTTPDGTPIPANGQDAAAPQLSTGKALQDEGIKTDAAGDAIIADIAYLSVDEGETWYRVTGEKGEQGDKGNTGSTGATGPAGPAGANGDSFFEDVEIVGNNVIFTLADGTTFTIAKYNGALTFMQNGKALDLTTTIDLADGALTYAPNDAEVSARIIDGEGWSASAANGTITVTPASMGEEATLEITLLENGRVIETYRLTIEQTGLQGEGTEDAPYTVSSAAELIYIAEQKNYYRKYIQLTQDIDLTGLKYTPIGSYMTPFYGTFDGDNHVIRGLEEGLFGLVNSGTIKNLTLESPTAKTGEYVGSFVNELYSGTIENCHVTNGTISSNTGDAGGIVGLNDAGHIINCSVTSTTITAQYYGGGIAGQMTAEYGETSITACRFSGTIIQSNTNSGGQIGGIVGYANGTDSSVKACYANCTLKATEPAQGYSMFTKAGGVVGLLYGSVTACYAIAKVENNPLTCGGVLGFQATLNSFNEPVDSEVSTCYWSGTDITHGIGGTGNPGNASPDTATDENTTKVDNSTTTWSTAMTAMNTALNGTGWQYVENGSDTNFPLVIKATE